MGKTVLRLRPSL